MMTMEVVVVVVVMAVMMVVMMMVVVMVVMVVLFSKFQYDLWSSLSAFVILFLSNSTQDWSNGINLPLPSTISLLLVRPPLFVPVGIFQAKKPAKAKGGKSRAKNSPGKRGADNPTTVSQYFFREKT
jgi:hypothetical protein